MNKLYTAILFVASIGLVAQEKSVKALFNEQKTILEARSKGLPEQDIKGYVNAKRADFIAAQGHKHTSQEYAEKVTHIMIDRMGHQQTLSTYCTNLDLSSLDYTNWVGDISNSNIAGTQYPIANYTGTGINGNNGAPILINTDPCNGMVATDRHVVMSLPIGPLSSNINNAFTSGYDPTCQNQTTGMFDLSMTPANGTNSIRLGSAYPQYTSEKLIYSIAVTSANCIFNYNFAIVISDGGHGVGEQPAFTLQLKDQSGNPIGGPCGQYAIDATAASTDTSFIKSTSTCINVISPTYYRKWNSRTLDLTAFIGQTINIEFESLDCVYSGHYCYGYVTGSCSPLILSVNMCAASSNQTIIGPPGYASYQWAGPNNAGNTIPGPNGTNDTLSIQNGSVNDVYYLTVVSTNGCTSNFMATLNYSQLQIQYQTSMLGSFYGNGSVNICNGDSLTLIVNGATTYTWSANAGSANTSSVTVYSSAGPAVYSVTATDNVGCTDTSFITIGIDSACVWPGDADENLVVDNLDLFAVGVKYNQTGPARTFQSNAWQGYGCTNWNDTLQNGTNIKYTDCNGNGLIEMNDTLAINFNYSQTHPAKMQNPQHTQASNRDLYLNFNKPLYYPGDTLLADVMWGTSVNQQVNMYGAAFTIDYDETMTKANSEAYSFINSWLGVINQSAIKFNKIFTSNGSLDASLVRINHSGVSGYGKVGQLRIVLRDTLGGNGWIYFNMSKSYSTTNNGELAPLLSGIDSAAIATNAVSIAKPALTAHLTVFPNPNNGSFAVNCSQSIDEIKITDVIGNLVYSAKPNSQKANLQIENAGVYFVTVITGKENMIKRIIVSK